VKDHIADGVVTDTHSFSQEMGDGSLTGHVGTALYVAPELTTSGSKEVYSQVRKVYSSSVMSHFPNKVTECFFRFYSTSFLGCCFVKVFSLSFFTPRLKSNVYYVG
jgi:hypothetical protein